MRNYAGPFHDQRRRGPYGQRMASPWSLGQQRGPRYETMPLFDEDYVNPARRISPEQAGNMPSSVIENRLRYGTLHGSGDPVTEEEAECLRKVLRRRKANDANAKSGKR